MPIDRPSVLVTGAGRGLGRAIADAFHSRDYFVVATDIDESLLADRKDTDRYLTLQQDASDIDRASEIAATIGRECGRLDVLVNNAGINSFYPVCEAPPKRTIRAFEINTFGALIQTQACLDLLIGSKATIVNIASESSPFRPPFQVYQSTKMALECLSDVMRRELQLLDVHVAIIRPGAIETILIEETRELEIDAPGSRFERFFPAFKALVGGRIPKRASQPSEVAELVVHAATDPKKKIRYTINNDPMQKLLPLLPQRFVDRMIRRQLEG
jgi:NAD(P)-dependent dehydrogenase (short-subunit alcohol dehydrogenase family)